MANTTFTSGTVITPEWANEVNDGIFYRNKSFRELGAVGDGVTNDTTTIQAILDAHPGEIIDGEGRTYACNAAIVITDDNTVIQNATFDFSTMPVSVGSSKCFEITGTLGTPVALTADTEEGTAVVAVGTTASFSVDGLVFLKSTTVWDTSTNTTHGHYARVKSIDSATQLTLHTKSLLDFTTAASATIAPVTPIRNIRFNNVKVIGSQSNTQVGIYIAYGENALFDGVQITSVDYTGIGLYRAYASMVVNSTVRFARDVDNAYGVAVWGGCMHTTIDNLIGEDCRHAVTIGDNDGLNCFTLVQGSHAIGAKDSGFDSHAASIGTHFINNIVEMSETFVPGSSHEGMIIQGAHAKFVGNIIKGVLNNGIHYQPLIPSTYDNDVLIADNTIILDDTGNGSAVAGIYADIEASDGGNIDSLIIRNNSIRGAASNPDGSRTIRVAINRANRQIKNVIIDGNIAVSSATLESLIFRAFGASSVFTNITITNNQLKSTTDRVLRILADGASSTVSNVVMANNLLDGGTTAGFQCSGTITNLKERGTLFVNATAKYDITSDLTNYAFDTRDNAPVTVAAATYTVLPSDEEITVDNAGTCTVTLPNATTCAGRVLGFRTIQAQSVISASSNVVPRAGGAAGTAIVPNTDGAWTMIKSDGTNWQIIRSS
jgi:hypothetical protein